MKALVTGATGFVGSHLVDLLLARGDTVTALVRDKSRAESLAKRGVQLILGDLNNTTAIAEAVSGQDVIYHVAAMTGAVDEAEFMMANRDGTANVVRAAVKSTPAPRFVLVSSAAAGGPSLPGEPRIADGHDAPVTMYGRSKLASEQVLRGEKLPWTIIRPPTVYGPRDKDNLLAVFKGARLGFGPVFGDGSMQVSLIHVVDLVTAIVAAGTTTATVGHIYYVNHPQVLSSEKLVRTIGDSMGKRIVLLPLPEWLARSALTVTELWATWFRKKTILRSDKANEFYQDAWTGDPRPFMLATGWEAKFDFATGCADTLAWYRTNGWL